MPEDKITPEERLLKIIEGPVQQARARPAGLLKQVQAVAPHDLINRFKKIHIDKDVFKKINLNTVNKTAILICGVFTIFLMVDLTRNSFMVGNRFDKLKAAVEVLGIQEAGTPQMDADINNIFSNNSGVNMFSAKPRKAETNAAPASVEAEVPLPNIKLVGIIWSESPQVMLEDSKENKTYLLNIGDKIGDITIKAIMQDKVIVTNGQRERELR